MKEKAFFVHRPRRVEELRRPHFPEQEETYVIAKRVCLSHLDFENFSEDLRADRAFLENLGDGESSGARRCVFVHCRNEADGVLVVPTQDGHVQWAAYID